MPRTAIQNANASLYFNGTSSLMTSPVAPSPTGFNFSMWCKVNKNVTNDRIFDYSDSGPSGGANLLVTSGSRIAFSIYNSASLDAILASTISPGTWTHIVGTYKANEAKLYVNGLLASSDTSITMTAPTQTLTFARRSAAASNYAGVNLSNIVWHNTTTPWTAEQVLALYQSGTVPTGATAVYPLNEGAGSIAYDTSGNGNNGTITSGTWTRDTPTKTRKAVGGNLVYNGDFEIAPVVNVPTTTGGRWIDGTASGSTTNNVFGWMYYNWTGTYGANFDTSVKRTGNASIKISTLATGSTVGVGVNGDTASSWAINNIPVLPSTSYTVSVWMKTQANSGTATTGARCFMQEFNGKGITSVISTNVVIGVITTTDWTRYTATFTTNSATRYISPKFSIIGNDGAATLIMDAWFDDITLTKTTPETRTAAGTRTVATGRSVA